VRRSPRSARLFGEPSVCVAVFAALNLGFEMGLLETVALLFLAVIRGLFS